MVRTLLQFKNNNRARVDAPMERRVNRWAFSLNELLSDKTGLLQFEAFLEGEFSIENLQFWLSVENLKQVPESQVKEMVQNIYENFIESGAKCEINIDSKTMEETINSLKESSRYTFDAAQSHIFLLMKKDSYQRFLRSEQYKNLLANAVNTCSKKKFTIFGSRKRSPLPSPKLTRRGSAGSSVASDKEIVNKPNVTLSHHSYSTGNLKELDTKITPKSSPAGSNNNIKGMTKNESEKSLSPNSIRKRITDLIRGSSKRKQSINLEVPQQLFAYTSSPESSDNEGELRITVPNKKTSSLRHKQQRQQCKQQQSSTEINVVAPWEDHVETS